MLYLGGPAALAFAGLSDGGRRRGRAFAGLVLAALRTAAATFLGDLVFNVLRGLLSRRSW